MKNIEALMRQLFETQVIEEKKIQAERALYRRKFFTQDCHWDSHEGTLEMLESEEIVNIEEKLAEAVVITTFNSSFHVSGKQTHRHKYHLKAGHDGWLIWLVETECPLCCGQRDESCIACKGKLWISSQRTLKPN